MHCKWPCLDAFPPLIADHNVTSKFLVTLLIRLSLLQTFPQYFPTGLHSAWTHGFFKILVRISKIGSDSLLWDRKLWSYEASFYRVTQTNTHRNRWQDWRCQGSFLRGKKVLPESYTCVARQISIQNSKKWIWSSWKKAFECCSANFPR